MPSSSVAVCNSLSTDSNTSGRHSGIGYGEVVSISDGVSPRGRRAHSLVRLRGRARADGWVLNGAPRIAPVGIGVHRSPSCSADRVIRRRRDRASTRPPAHPIRPSVQRSGVGREPQTSARRRTPPAPPRRSVPFGRQLRRVDDPAGAAEPQHQPGQPPRVARRAAAPAAGRRAAPRRPRPGSSRPPSGPRGVELEGHHRVVAGRGEQRARRRPRAGRPRAAACRRRPSTSIRATRSSRNSRTSSARWHQPSRYQRPSTFVTRIGSTSRSVVSSRAGTR